MRALMTRKSCAVEMRNAILRNHLNYMDLALFSSFKDAIQYCIANSAPPKRVVFNYRNYEISGKDSITAV